MKRLLGPIVAILYLSGCRAHGPAQRSVFVPLDGAPSRHDHTAPGRNSVLLRAGGNSRTSRACDFPRNSDHASSRPVDAGSDTHRAAEQVFSARRIQLSKLAAPANRDAGAARRNGPAPGAPTGGPSVIAAGSWQSPKDTRSESPLANQPSAQPRPDPSIVRIVEPANAVPANPALATAAATATPSNAPTDVLQPASATPTTLPATVQATATAMPATTSTASVTASTQPQTPDRPAIQELTDLPAVGASSQSGAKSPTNTAQATGQMSDRAMQVAAQAPDRAMPVNTPAEQPGATYGYDPDSKTLRGKLEYSVAARRWKLIYLSPDGPIDEYGGSVILPDPGQLNGFEAGDFVTVQGTFTPPTAGGGVPMFAIQRIKRQ